MTNSKAGVAGFPMYDLPEVRGALDSLWAALAKELRAAGSTHLPAGLLHDEPLNRLWHDQALFVSQCCGYDLVNRHIGVLCPLVTPRYTAPGCDGTDYCSHIVVAKNSEIKEIAAARGRVCAINGFESHSGMNALRTLVAPFHRQGKFFSRVWVSGTHAASLAAVARGEADICAIDCVTHALLAHHRPAALAGTRILCRSAAAPAIPFVTRVDRGGEFAECLQTALMDVLKDPTLAEVRQELLIEGGEILPPGEYDRIAEFETQAAAAGYPHLR